jgi:hypothetical protein
VRCKRSNISLTDVRDAIPIIRAPNRVTLPARPAAGRNQGPKLRAKPAVTVLEPHGQLSDLAFFLGSQRPLIALLPAKEAPGQAIDLFQHPGKFQGELGIASIPGPVKFVLKMSNQFSCLLRRLKIQYGVVLSGSPLLGIPSNPYFAYFLAQHLASSFQVRMRTSGAVDVLLRETASPSRVLLMTDSIFRWYDGSIPSIDSPYPIVQQLIANFNDESSWQSGLGRDAPRSAGKGRIRGTRRSPRLRPALPKPRGEKVKGRLQ